ncbi:MAG: hypothetical protein E6713_13650 [Sporomusaceae bacterium]|nr:hypothetical protein [Sporomusaceae bacterium]
MQLPAGLLLLVGYLGLIALGNIIGLFHSLFLGDVAGIYTSLPGIFLYAFPAYGLFKTKRWAWFAEIAISTLAVLLGLLVFLLFNPLMGIIACLIHGLILYYLFRKSIKTLYLSKPSSESLV